MGRHEAGDADFFLAATCQMMVDIAVIGEVVASPSNMCAHQQLAQNASPSQTWGASQRCARRPRQNHGLENRLFQPRLLRWSPWSHRKISCSPMVCRKPCVHAPASLLDNDIWADPAKIAGSRFDFSSRTYASVLFPSSPARITSSRACASATRACTAHARRARVCIAFEGNVVLGTVGHGHPRGVRHPPALRGARERANARRHRLFVHFR